MHSEFHADSSGDPHSKDEKNLPNDGDGDTPRDWHPARKRRIVTLVALYTFLSPYASAMLSPALDATARELGAASKAEAMFSLSSFILGYAVGSLFWSPLSEVFGRLPVLHTSNFFFLAFNLACGFATSEVQLIVLRFWSGVGGIGVIVVSAGVLGDISSEGKRGKVVAIYSLLPLIAPALSPLISGFIVERASWRWLFWSTSIAGGAIAIVGLFLLEETFAPKLLQTKKQRVAAEFHTQPKQQRLLSRISELLEDSRSSNPGLWATIKRPIEFLFTQPIVAALALYMSYLYGLLYLFIADFPILWTTRYGETMEMAGLNFISFGLGLLIGALPSFFANDRVYCYLRRRYRNDGKPEYRLPLMLPASFLVPAGLLTYGWSAQARVFWLVPNFGTVIFAAGVWSGYQSIQIYTIDYYLEFAASAVSALTFVRSIIGSTFPLFTPCLFRDLGYGWGCTLLAGISILFGLPAPVLLWFYGEELRRKSTLSEELAGDAHKE